MLRDVRFGARVLLKQPGFTLIAVLTLALGIGATSAVFSLIQGVLLTPPPYREPERLVLVKSARSNGELSGNAPGWAAAQWQEWQKESKSLDAIGAYSWAFTFLVLPDGSVSLQGMSVTAEYFRALGVQPVLGRTFLGSETGATPAPVIILGYDLWQRQFHGDRNILGNTIRLNGFDKPAVVIGVMSRGVRFLPSPEQSKEPNYNENATVDFWIPAVVDPLRSKEPGWDVVGRLRSGTTRKEAQAELTGITARQAEAKRDFAGIVPRVQSLIAEANRDGSRVLMPLLGAAALVLLIACGNAAALLLVRGLQRQQEYAVRSALGVGRLALFRQVATETLLVALLGGAFGVILAFGIVKVFQVIGAHAIPRLDAVTTGWAVLVCALGSSVLASVLAGLYPALRASRLDPVNALKSAGPKSSVGRRERRVLQGVTIAQTALSLALLVGAGLLIRTMVNLSKVESGYETGHILTMSVTAVQGEWATFHHRALARVSALPGVQGAAFAWGVPLSGNNWPWGLDIEGRDTASKGSDQIWLPVRAVTPGYFQLLGMTIADGRDFRSSDKGTAVNVAVINRAFADRYLRRGRAIGKKLWLFGREKPPTEIIGVVANGRTDDLTEAAGPQVYLSLWQSPAVSKHLVIRTVGDPRSVMASVQRELRLVDPTVAVENMKTLEQIRSDSLASRTFAMQVLVGFGVVGIVLTLVGIYSVLSLSVASRRREIAIRVAVGAQRRDIRGLVFGEGLMLIAGGLASGLAAAWILSRVLMSFLFEIKPGDPLTLMIVGLLFASMALLACWVPSHRAMEVNPIEALRYD